MMIARWTSPAPTAGTLRLRRSPFCHGLGWYKDTEGRTWDVNMVVAIQRVRYVCARRVDTHPRYSTTGLNWSGMTRWLPYDVEVVPAQETGQ